MNNWESNSGSKKKVCVIDDEASIREIYKTALEHAGYDVVTAADGEEGLEVINVENPDIALVDIMMPKMDGMEMIKILRKNEKTSGLRIIVTTNVDDQDIMRKIGKLGTQFYLVKSLFEPKKVVNIVDEVLHKS